MNNNYQSLKSPPDGKAILDRAAHEIDSSLDVLASLGAGAQAIRAVEAPYRTETLDIPAGGPLLPFADSETEAAEQYRLLRTNIRLHPSTPKVIAVSSPMAGDGKTITSINIAAILALKEGSRVLLIDGDLRQQAVGRSLGLRTELGLSELIGGHCAPADAIVRTDRIPNLHVLTAGAVMTNPAELLDSDSFRSLVSMLRTQFSYIVFDTTPITAVADFKLVQQVCDGLILVVRPGFTNRSEFLKALEIEPKQKLLGVVINAFQDWFLYQQSGGYCYRRTQPPAGRRGAASNR